MPLQKKVTLPFANGFCSKVPTQLFPCVQKTTKLRIRLQTKYSFESIPMICVSVAQSIEFVRAHAVGRIISIDKTVTFFRVSVFWPSLRVFSTNILE
jgi:hypothetical protein